MKPFSDVYRGHSLYINHLIKRKGDGGDSSKLGFSPGTIVGSIVSEAVSPGCYGAMDYRNANSGGVIAGKPHLNPSILAGFPAAHWYLVRVV